MSNESIEISEFDKRYIDGFAEKCAAAKADPIAMAKYAGMDKLAKGGMMRYLGQLLGSAPGGNIAKAKKLLINLVKNKANKAPILQAGKDVGRAELLTRASRKRALPALAGLTGGLAIGSGAIGAGSDAIGKGIGKLPGSLAELDRMVG